MACEYGRSLGAKEEEEKGMEDETKDENDKAGKETTKTRENMSRIKMRSNVPGSGPFGDRGGGHERLAR